MSKDWMMISYSKRQYDIVKPW